MSATSEAQAPLRTPYLVPAVTRALVLLDMLARERKPMSMAGIAHALELPKSSVHGICNTLLTLGYLRRTDNGFLQIGPSVMSLADAFVASTNVAGEFDAMWRDAGSAPDETMILSVLAGREVIYVGVRNSTQPLSLSFTVGMRLPANLAATGKAMLAYLDPSEVQAMFEGTPLPQMTGGAPTLALPALQAELEETRRRGYSIDDGAVRQGVYSMAAPVFDSSGRPVAGVGVCINKAVLNDDQQERQRQVVTQAARRLSLRLGARETTST